MYFPRIIEAECRRLAKLYPILTITGPRQSGKTTLLRHCFPEKPYYNLEAPDILQAIPLRKSINITFFILEMFSGSGTLSIHPNVGAKTNYNKYSPKKLHGYVAMLVPEKLP